MFPIPPYVHTALAALRDAGYEAYPVGGCVRDCLMGVTPADWDLCTSALPEQVEAVFAGWRLVETGVKHGTVTVISEGRPVEITTFRTDGTYRDHRRPDSVAFVSSLREDLARRDFTVNAMALGLSGDVIDPFGGQADLRAGLIRCVGDPDRRFSEDALRILRALRFASRLDFAVEETTAASAVENRALLDSIARERVFSELKGILTGPGAGRTLREFAPVIFQIIPALAAEAGFDQKNPHHIHDVWTHTTMAVDAAARSPVLRLAMLLHDVGKPDTFFTDQDGVGHFYGHAARGEAMADDILRRLRCDNDTRRRVCLLIHYHDIRPPQTERAMRRLLAKAGREAVGQLFQCWRADSADRSDAVRAENRAVIDGAEAVLETVLAGPSACFDVKSLAVNGRDILAMGVRPGPAVGRTLDALLERVMDGTAPNQREPLMALAAEIINRKKTDKTHKTREE